MYVSKYLHSKREIFYMWLSINVMNEEGEE